LIGLNLRGSRIKMTNPTGRKMISCGIFTLL